ncbi:MAG TPA: ABC transporter ATP-binding protein [Spirochaetia bacterium]|nr:ABC transporter ATP-binding protein [Spirochaetia bacterium]
MNGRKNTLLEVRDLKTQFFTEMGVVKAVDGVDFEIYPGETLGIVGESGCGKSVTSLSILRLIIWPPGKIMGGQVLFNGSNLTKLNQQQMQNIRGNDISMIFQEPMTSLNPVYRVGDQIAETIMLHKGVSKKEALSQALEMIRKVGIPEPRQRIREYPHQLSGGMRQRVMIAMALSCDPQLLIADEPTTALDVTIQAQILKLMRSLKDRLGMSIMLITHDLGVIAETAERVVVMYAGKVVEYTGIKTLFRNPMHPYTWGLRNSIPRMDMEVDWLPAIPGIVPNPLRFPSGCKYHTRCTLVTERCREEEPALFEIESHHLTRCWHYDKMDRLRKEAEAQAR